MMFDEETDNILLVHENALLNYGYGADLRTSWVRKIFKNFKSDLSLKTEKFLRKFLSKMCLIDQANCVIEIIFHNPIDFEVS